MFFRFGSALVVVVLISAFGIALEKRNFELRREVTRQRYRTDALTDMHARLRLETHQLGAPLRVIDRVEDGQLEMQPDIAVQEDEKTPPLLYWQRPETQDSSDCRDGVRNR